VINFILNAASSLASIICGVVYQDLGWLWLFNMLQIFCVFQFLLMFFFCPETTYLRDTRYNTDLTGADAPEVMGLESKPDVEKPVEHAERDINVPAKKTFVQELAVYTGVYSQDSIFKFLAGPFLTLLNPAACYAVIASGLLNSWYVGSAIILAGIFAGPPWTFNAAQIGYLG
jgi:hypothetical protein